MKQWRNRMLVTITLTGVMFTSACQGEAKPEPLPPAESSTTAAVPPSPSPTPTPAWESKYTPQQLRAYEAALRRFQEYETKSEPIWRAGKANARTERFFKEYFFAWPTQQRLLTTYEKVEVRSFGLGRTLTSRPTRIVASEGSGGQSVTIRQCVDFNSTHTTQYGKRVEQITTKPQVRIDIPILRPEEIRQLPERQALVIAETGKPIIAKLTRCLDGPGGRQLLADQRSLREQLTRQSVVTPEAHTTAALVQARRLGFVDHHTTAPTTPAPGDAIQTPRADQ